MDGRCSRAAAAAVLALLPLSAVGPVEATGAAVAAAPSWVRTVGGPAAADIYPSGLDVAPDGTVYVADTGNDAVVAYSSAGDRLWAVGRRGPQRGKGFFENPRDVAVLGASVYVVDSGAQRVQVLDRATGAVRSVWPAALASPMGISRGVDGQGRPVLLVAESATHRVSVFTPQGTLVRRLGSGRGAGPGQLDSPRDAATDATGRTYVADYLNNRVAVFSPTGTWLADWGGTGSAPGSYIRPYGTAVDDAGRVYVADSNNHRVQVLSGSGRPLRVLGSRGSGQGRFEHLRRVAVGPGRDPLVYGADLWQYKVEVFAPTGVAVRTLGGRAPAPGGFNEPAAVAVDGEGLFVVDSVNQRVQRFGAPPRSAFQLGFGDRGWGAELTGFNWPRSLALDAARGTVWVADTKNSRLVETDRAGSPTGRVLGSAGSGPTQVHWPLGVSAAGGAVFVADTQNNRVQRWDPATGTVRWTAGGVGLPWDVLAVGDEVLVADSRGRRVVRLDARTGALRGSFGSGALQQPAGLAVTPAGHVWVADRGAHRVVEFSAGGVLLQSFGTRGTAHGAFSAPSKVAVFQRELYVTDTFNHRVEVFALPPG